MSQKNSVLYGSRLYGQSLYALTEDFETYNTAFYEATSLSDAQAVQTITKAINDILASADVTTISSLKSLLDTEVLTEALVAALTKQLSETLPLSDATAITATKAVMDALLAVDGALVTLGTKPLDDAASLTDQIAATIQKVFTDVLNVLESRLLIDATKELTDFINFREWVSITLKKVNPWQTVSLTQAPAPLYGVILYGQSLYGYTRSNVWNKPTASRQSFTNQNGESH